MKLIIKNKYKGFTLIELLAVILILGIIALIAVPVVNDVLNDSKMGAFKTTAMNMASKDEENCQLEGIKDKEVTRLYTIVDGKLDKPLEIKGDIPNEGYILINNNCEVAYSFYDSKNVVSKNFKEDKPTINNKETSPVYGLKWQSNKDTLNDTYTRTHDASNIADNSVKVQIGDTPVANAFDMLDIYKDILPYTDEFGNEFMLIPKFYISKTKEVSDTEVVWNYAVSKHKLDDTYYLPSNFVDEGINNDEHIELPYVLVGKYEAGSNGLTGEEEILVSKSGLEPKVDININDARSLITKYNNIEDVNGYQQYDIHVHDLLTVLFAIEFKTMNNQSIMYGYTNYNEQPTVTGCSDMIKSSSGSKSNGGFNSFHYRGMENIWGNVSSFLEGLIIDQINNEKNDIYVCNNSRIYSSENIENIYTKIIEYKKLSTNGYTYDIGYDPKFPYANLPIKVGDYTTHGVNDFYYQNDIEEYKIGYASGHFCSNFTAGLNRYNFTYTFLSIQPTVGTRIVKTPLQN